VPVDPNALAAIKNARNNPKNFKGNITIKSLEIIDSEAHQIVFA